MEYCTLWAGQCEYSPVDGTCKSRDSPLKWTGIEESKMNQRLPSSINTPGMKSSHPADFSRRTKQLTRPSPVEALTNSRGFTL